GIWIYPGGYRGRSKGEDAGVVMWCTARCGRGGFVPAPVRTEAVLLQQNQSHPRPVGAPAPGAKGDLNGTWIVVARFAPWAVLLQQNQSHLRTVGAPAPGAKGCCPVEA